jgi:hypothetical protein
VFDRPALGHKSARNRSHAHGDGDRRPRPGCQRVG